MTAMLPTIDPHRLRPRGWYGRTRGFHHHQDAITSRVAGHQEDDTAARSAHRYCLVRFGGITTLNSSDSPPSRVAARSIAIFRQVRIRPLVLIFLCLAMFASTATISAEEQLNDQGFGPSIGAENAELSDVALETIDLPASGQFIVDYAMQFYGYPYVAAGNGPGGFDCSGFTQYVMLNMLGIDIGHGVAGQTGYGYWVDWGNWQAGDLVFFAGTYRDGISHVGIYIGDGQFIHAENEGTGVTISSVWSDYYSGHYYGAYRLI
jgi:cell wall-associated NlpC family hydrolase